MENLLLNPPEVEYAVQQTPFGVWRRFMFSDGRMFAEFRSNGTLFGMPWLHVTWGRCPETMRRITAKGIVAIGRFAVGPIAIGQVCFGAIAIGQLAIGVLLGLGQATAGIFALGQLALSGIIGIGQLACGHMAIGQLAFGEFVLAQFGWGTYVWDMKRTDVEAVQFFRQLLLK